MQFSFLKLPPHYVWQWSTHFPVSSSSATRRARKNPPARNATRAEILISTRGIPKAPTRRADNLISRKDNRRSTAMRQRPRLCKFRENYRVRTRCWSGWSRDNGAIRALAKCRSRRELRSALISARYFPRERRQYVEDSIIRGWRSAIVRRELLAIWDVILIDLFPEKWNLSDVKSRAGRKQLNIEKDVGWQATISVINTK